jgi:hypothetical protein
MTTSQVNHSQEVIFPINPILPMKTSGTCLPAR